MKIKGGGRAGRPGGLDRYDHSSCRGVVFVGGSRKGKMSREVRQKSSRQGPSRRGEGKSGGEHQKSTLPGHIRTNSSKFRKSQRRGEIETIRGSHKRATAREPGQREVDP